VLLGIAFVVAVSVFAYKELSGQVKGANAYLRTLKANDLEAGYTHVCDSAKATLTEAAYVRRSSERMAALGPISSYFVSPSTLHVRDHPEYNAVEVKVVASSGIHHYLGELVHEDGTWHWCGTARRVGQTEAPLPLP
jgi:hypothetical protein